LIAHGRDAVELRLSVLAHLAGDSLEIVSQWPTRKITFCNAAIPGRGHHTAQLLLGCAGVDGHVRKIRRRNIRFLVTDYGSVEQLKYEGGYMSTATPILASPNVCRILSLDGGGAKGFYTLGVLKQVEGMLGGEPLCAAA